MPRKHRLTQPKGKDQFGQSTRRPKTQSSLNRDNVAAEQLSMCFDQNSLKNDVSATLLIHCDSEGVEPNVKEEKQENITKVEGPQEIGKTTTEITEDAPEKIESSVNQNEDNLNEGHENCKKNNLDSGRKSEKPLMLGNLTVPIGVEDRAKKTLPTSALEIKRSPIHGLGVFSKVILPIGILLGPYEGEIKTKHETGLFCWGLTNGRMVDAEDETKSSWLRYINCARHSREQNLVSCQRRGKLYFRTTKLIPVGQELLVFYGLEFAHFLKIDVNRYFNNTPRNIVNFNTNSEVKKIDTVGEDGGSKSPKEEVSNDLHRNSKRPDIEDNVDKSIKPKRKRRCTVVRPFRCRICQKCFNHRITYNIHMNKHHSEMCQEKEIIKSFKCDKCSYVAFRKRNFIQHGVTHGIIENLTKYKCSNCEFSTYSNSNFNKHKLRHSDKKPFVCKFCDFSCKQISYLTKHIRIRHMSTENEKRFHCDQCQFSTRLKSNLNRHKFTHTTVKAFNCKICQKGFYSKHLLKQHMNIYHQEMCQETDKMERLRCDKCSYSTFVKANLKTHNFRHIPRKRFVCKICEKKFAQISRFKLHLERKHLKR